MTRPAHHSRILWRIKTFHTAAWLLFALAILAIPIAVILDRLSLALWLSLLVWAEVFILLFNGMRCPLTGIAARYTADRADNFDIFLPAWLARHNKLIFGTVFAAAQLFLLWRWQMD